MDGVRAFLGRREPKPLLCDTSKLVGLSERLVRSHWENNYGGAVKALNALMKGDEVKTASETLD
jgi:Fe-Mn family superoxide dismutase